MNLRSYQKKNETGDRFQVILKKGTNIYIMLSLLGDYSCTDILR